MLLYSWLMIVVTLINVWFSFIRGLSFLLILIRIYLLHPFTLEFERDFIFYISASTYLVTRVLIKEYYAANEHVIYYVSNNLHGPLLSYLHKENLLWNVVFSVQKLRHYILTHTTKFVTNYNPMAFRLSRWVINRKYACWIIILKKIDSKFFIPKSNKDLSLPEFISKFPTSFPYPLVNDELPHEH